MAQFISETITCLASGSSMLYWVPAGPSLTLSPRRKPRRVINVLAASSTDGGGPSSWLDSPAEAERQKEEGGGEGEERRHRREKEYVSVVGRNRTAAYLAIFTEKISFKFLSFVPSLPGKC